ncbi:hypothetical protein [Actinoplanes sp. NBRC 101535]|uniref:hypothetical protein n=1 Tax=Actinoplanes sp. NBRC 101535 TaxID=3032196 RepID=UPI0024A2249D|nr:hypothetical protein [Actinoplanes sp. NBRC 101535]GLY01921.1 hypothetical protein Acsp01_23000 [Actinoplanes sp. NBRC 101535]
MSTIVYQPFHADGLALNLDRSKDFGTVTPATFRRFGERIGYPVPEELETLAGAFTDRMRETWRSVIAGGMPLTPEMTELIRARLSGLPLARLS